MQRTQIRKQRHVLRYYLIALTALSFTGLTRAKAQTQASTPYLSDTTYWVTDTSDYASLRLHVINPSDSLVIIERVQPSCGCVLATTQRNLATRQKPGDIYVAVTTHKLDTLQPITIDVYTNMNRTIPMRLYIRRLPHKTNETPAESHKGQTHGKPHRMVK